MIFTACKQPSLLGCGVEFSAYSRNVSSPDYDFGLIGGECYALLGIDLKDGLACLGATAMCGNLPNGQLIRESRRPTRSSGSSKIAGKAGVLALPSNSS